MAKLTPQTILFNGAGIGIGLLSAVYMINSALFTPTIPQCSQRYQKAIELGLKSRSGKPMTPIELETRAGLGSSGVLENASVELVDGAPSAAALKVRLEKGSGSVHAKDAKPGGISFLWKPSGMAGATAACLSYSVFLPSAFDFGGAGVLPGLFGGADPDVGGHTRGFATRLMWNSDGMGQIDAELPNASSQQGASAGGEIDVQIPISDSARSVPIGPSAFRLPRGRWVSIEQEVVLNSPDKSDGVARLWIDGTLKIERNDLHWRGGKMSGLAGVIADVSYGGVDNGYVAPADTALHISALQARWK